MGIYPVKPLLLTLELRECCQNLGAMTTWINIRPDLGDVSACACPRDQALRRNLIVLLALSDADHSAYEAKRAEAIASLGSPVFAWHSRSVSLDDGGRPHWKRFGSWAAEADIALIRGS